MPKIQTSKKIICVVGPTAVGKTSYAIELAKKHQTVVLNADARQIYKELVIGTAKPSLEEMDGVPHYLLDYVSIHQNYTVGNYEQDALGCCKQLFETRDTLILVGGSGLFVHALCFGLDDVPIASEAIRDQVRLHYAQEGLESIQNALLKLDHQSAKYLDIQNPHRVMRALEVMLHSGKPIQHYQNQQNQQRDFEVSFIGLNRDRKVLYERINLRVDLMIEAGLLAEVESLKPYQDLKALKTVGYQEFYEAEKTGKSIDCAIDQVKQASRHYAKRQITWFKKTPGIQWVEVK